MKVTARIGSAFLVASSSGADVFPLLVGQLVEDHPMGFVVRFKLTLKVFVLKVHLPHHWDLGKLPLHFHNGQPDCSQGGEEQEEFSCQRKLFEQSSINRLNKKLMFLKLKCESYLPILIKPIF